MPDDANLPAPQWQSLIYADGASQLQVRLDGNTVWLTQRLIAELYDVTVPNVNQHLKAIYEEGELPSDRTIKHYLIIQREGTRKVETLSIDACKLGSLRTHTLRVLSGLEDAKCVPGLSDPLPIRDIGRIVYPYRQWRGEPKSEWPTKNGHGEWDFVPTPSFCKPGTVDEIPKHGPFLTPEPLRRCGRHRGRRRTFRGKIPATGREGGGARGGGGATGCRRSFKGRIRGRRRDRR